MCGYIKKTDMYLLRGEEVKVFVEIGKRGSKIAIDIKLRERFRRYSCFHAEEESVCFVLRIDKEEEEEESVTQ